MGQTAAAFFKRLSPLSLLPRDQSFSLFQSMLSYFDPPLYFRQRVIFSPPPSMALLKPTRSLTACLLGTVHWHKGGWGGEMGSK